MEMVMLVPLATLTVQTYEPEAPDWSGRFSIGAAETWPAGRIAMRTAPVAPVHCRAAGWHWVIEGGVLMVAWPATAAAKTTAPAAAEAILTILTEKRSVSTKREKERERMQRMHTGEIEEGEVGGNRRMDGEVGAGIYTLAGDGTQLQYSGLCGQTGAANGAESQSEVQCLRRGKEAKRHRVEEGQGWIA